MGAGNRISGKLGTMTIEGAGVNLLFDWTMEWNRDVAEVSIKGEVFEQYAAGTFTGRITAKRHSTDSTGDSELARTVPIQSVIGSALDGGTTVAYVLRQIAGSGQSITGQGICVRGSLSAPREMAEDEVEIMLTSVPTLN